jgi:hypothetical protein
MKYITLIIGLLVMGCGKQNPPVVEEIKSVKAPAKELTKEDIVGSYTLMGLSSWVFDENGKTEFLSQAGRKVGEGKWKLVENEVHTDSMTGQNVYRIEPNGDMTFIAGIDKEGKREELPNGSQMTWEKIKSKPVKELTLREKVIGAYEGKEGGVTFKIVLLENGVTEVYANGEKGESVAKWIIVDGKIHIIDENAGRMVARINKDDSLTPIADILDGKRINIPKDEQTTLKKIK